jgi:multidrug efflux pump
MNGFNPSAWAVAHRSLVLFMILAIAAAGLFSYTQLGRAEDPSFTIKVMVVTASWPGATAEEVQNQVAERIEKKLQELPHVDRVQTFSRPGFAAVTLMLRDDTPPKMVADIWYQARKKIGDMKSTLPDGVIGPQADDEYGDVYSGVYYFTGDGLTPADLKRLAEDARQRFLRLPGVAKVVLVGDRPEKVFVEFSHAKLATLGVTPRQVFDSLARQNAVTPAGSVDTAHDRVFVRVDGALDAAAHVRDVPVEVGGRLFRLGDVAEVKRGYEDPPEFTVRHNGKPAVGLSVAMAAGGNVLELGKSMQTEADHIRAELPVGAELHETAFQPHVVEESVGEFVQSFVEALAIVLLVSFVTLGFRTGIVVALSVPLVLAISFVVMRATGMNLDRISLGALIIALGLLVDDAIIAVETMVVKMEQGWDRVRAATFAWQSTALPMLTGTLITAAGFLPVGFASSSAGEYAGGIFWVVGLALIASWVVAVVFTPYLGVKLLPDHRAKQAEPGEAEHHDPYQSRFYVVLRAAITACVRRPRTVVALTISLFIAAVVGFTQVQQQFFPQSSRPELLVELQLPEGASFRAAETEVTKLESLLKDAPDVKAYSSYTGAGAPRFYLSLNPDLPDPSFAKVVIVTHGPESRERLLTKLRDVFAEGQEFPNARGRVSRLDFGPPVGFPVQFRVVGPEPKTSRQIAEQVRDVVRKNQHTQNAEIDWGETVRTVRLHIDQDRARALGLTPQDVSESMQTLLSGLTVTRYREGIELIDVVARAVPSERLSLGTLPDINLTTRSGTPVALAQVATVSIGQEDPILRRWNREPTVIVRTDVADGIQPADVTAAILPQLQSIRDNLPPGYRIEVGGSAEESGKANASLFAVFPVMILVMLTLLMIQLQNFRKALLVFAISPLGLIGVTGGLLLFNAPFGFVALLGLISLAGMDMRNSVILMDQIEHDLEAGRSPWDAVIEATVRRSRPVVLTAATAILAMVPLTRSVFWGPMAIAIMGGLSVATFLTLVNLPALYVLLFRVRPTESSATTERQQTGESHTMRYRTRIMNRLSSCPLRSRRKTP